MCVFEHDLREEGRLEVRRLALIEEIPLCVQRKSLDAGVALTREQWRALPRAARNRLTSMPVTDDFERRNFATLAAWLLRTFTSDAGRTSLAPDVPLAESPWHRADPPTALSRALAERDVDWSSLSPDARFALLHASSVDDLDVVLDHLREAPAECVGAPCVSA